MRDIKTFLTDNKIYFETLAATTISLSAVALSCMAIVVSCKSNTIAENSSQVSKIPYLPNISAYFRLDKSKDGKGRTETLVINNSGDVMYHFTSFPFAFIKLNELELIAPGMERSSPELKNVEIPLINYFPALTFVSNINKGVFSELTIDNTQKMDEVINDFSADYRTYDKSMGGSIERYLMVKYEDKFSEEHTEFFSFEAFGTSVPMSIDKGKELLSRYEQLQKQSGNYVIYNEATKNDLIKIWQEKASNHSSSD